MQHQERITSSALRAILALSLLATSWSAALAQAPPSSQCVTTAVAGGTGDALTVPTLPCVPTTTLLILTTPNANSTTAPTLSYPGGQPLPIQQFNGAPLAAGQLVVNGHYMLTSNGAAWFLLQSSQVSSGTAPFSVTDTKTGPITTTGWAIQGASSNQATSDQLESYVFCTAPGTATSCGGGNYDGVAGIGISNPGTTTNLVTGLSGYVYSNQPFSGSGPFAVALFGTGAVGVDGGRIEGLNVNVSDRQYRVAQPHGTHNRLVQVAELDGSVSYDDTNMSALLIAGNSVLQGLNTTAIAVVGQDFSAPLPGSIAKWSQAIYTYPGVATHFANIGTKRSPDGTPTFTSDAQDFEMGSYIGNVGFQGLFYFGRANSPNFGSTTNPSFNFNYPIQTWTGGLTARTAADQIVQLSGPADLTSGASIVSRNDVNSSLMPLELVSDITLVNAPFVLLQKNASFLNTSVGCGATTKGSIAIVTDAAATPAWNQPMAGGGSGFNLVMCTGTQWVYQ